MRPLPAVAALLAAAGSSAALAALAAELGFSADPLPLDDDARAALALDAPPLAAARVVPGPGAARALLVECDAGAPLRDAVAAVARPLAARTPHLSWLLLAAQRNAPGLAIAAWDASRAPPRIAALLVDRTRVVPSDAETVAALAAVETHDDLVAHAAWLDILGREALGRRFYRALERVVGALADGAAGRAGPEHRAELALLQVSRLLFLSFLETRGWLDGDPRFLAARFARCMERGGGFHARVLLPLFFGTLNTPLARRAPAARALGRIPFFNGGLFARTALERRHADLRFGDEALGLVVGELLGRWRFTVREESAAWSETAVDPEMLGRAFESLMGAADRRASGAYFTPHPLVARVTRAALLAALPGGALTPEALSRALDGESIDRPAAVALRERVSALRLLDPACGSGAFLVHALEELSALLAVAGDPRSGGERRRAILARSLFGVDANPTAVWLCELRLWLAVVTESDTADPLAVPPLPNLDRHVRVGDALAGGAFGDAAPPRGGARLALLRERYARATGGRKHTLERALARAERATVVAHLESELARCAARRRDLLAVLRGRDLFGERVRPDPRARERLALERATARATRDALRRARDGAALPFAWSTHFPDVARAGGFDIVVGNPPWVRPHHVPAPARAALRARFACLRDPAWTRGAEVSRAGAGFAAQVDLAALFAERSVGLLRDGGALALLLPAKLWRALAGGGLRRLLAERCELLALEDWSESPSAFDAAVYPSLLVARRRAGAARPAPPAERRAPSADCRLAVHRPRAAIAWELPAAALGFDESPASPWLVVPPPVRAAFDRVQRAGLPLGDGAAGPPLLGVKCGCNEAFVVRWRGGDPGLARVEGGGRTGCVERAVLRPLLRGERVAPWRPSGDAEWIVWTHDDDGAPLPTLPPHAARWLAPWRGRLTRRADARDRAPWWSLFRTAGAHPRHARVVWADIGRTPRALVLPPGDRTVALNSCYLLSCAQRDDARAVAALLNGPLAAAWLRVLAEPARGGYHRFLAWTIALLPIPRDWPRARSILAPLAARAESGNDPSPDALLDAALRAYRLRHAHVAPLLAWCAG